jgi:peptide/nickel transport system permease protein
MSEYLIKRLLMAAVTLFVILLVSYFLVRLAPGDPTKNTIIGESAAAQGISSEKNILAQNKSLREKLYLDKPILVGFSFWLRGIIFHGDFGESASVDKGRPVTRLILERLPVTVSLNFFAILFTYLLAIPIGIHSAITSRKNLDRGFTFFLLFLYSIPTFWIALLLQACICQGGLWPLFPLKGIYPENTWGLGTWSIIYDTARHYVLPVFCLSYAGFAGLSRYARASMIEVVRQDYIRSARAKGLPEHIVILKHAFRNALITLITLFAELLPGLVAGSIIIEYVFSIPGMGSLSMMALNSRDIPVLMALFGFGGILTLAGIIIADLMYVAADPRISFDKGSR